MANLHYSQLNRQDSKVKLLERVLGPERARMIREFRAKKEYADIPERKLRVPIEEVESVRQVEAHIVLVHLADLEITMYGPPVYDLLLLKALGAESSIERVLQIASIFFARKLDELDHAKGIKAERTDLMQRHMDCLQRQIDELVLTILFGSNILKGGYINFHYAGQTSLEYAEFLGDTSRGLPSIAVKMVS